MSTKSSPWQHTASAAPQYGQTRPTQFTPQEGLDNNWVFFPEPHFVNIDEEEEEEDQSSSGRRDSVGSVGEEQAGGRPGMQQRQDSWVGWWGKIFKSKL